MTVGALHVTVEISLCDAELPGELTIPADAQGLIVFAHGSGSSRLSTRNRRVADALSHAGLATLLFDLLTGEEHQVDQTSLAYRFDIPRLARRVVGTLDWLAEQPETQALPIGMFGASTGAAAALIAASERPRRVRAVVSRGGRVDLAGEHLGQVRAPTLLIVGELDEQVLALNEGARASLVHSTTELEIIDDAGHLFESPGALERVADLARDWFVRHCPGR